MDMRNERVAMLHEENMYPELDEPNQFVDTQQEGLRQSIGDYQN